MNQINQSWYLLPQDVPEYVEGYRIIRLLGEGGMGFVFLAEQETPIRRNVAIKFLRKGFEVRFRNRFEMESQMLAQMNHPNIAVVHDTGLTEGGQPFLVMEFVDGMPLDQYCDKGKLTTANRMDLFLQVCSGVIYAHQKGIIHRDLKPENLLVTELSGKSILKIIDFGIAKDLHLNKSGDMTRDGEMLGTPYYISPEQANGLEIDTRTDVFSLGAVMFQLLTGKYPFEESDQSFIRYLSDLISKEAPMPSQKIAEQKESLIVHAENRQVSIQVWIKEMRGDLDWIAHKALSRVQEKRYQSVSELVRDIERYRSGLPIEARPNTTVYMVEKFIQRHKMGVLAFSSIFASLIIALIISIHSLNQIRESEKAARLSEMHALREANKSKAINEFLENILMSPDPNQDGKDVRILDLLKEHEEKFDRYEGQEEIEASVRATLGRTYLGLGQYDDANRHLRESIKLEEHLDTVDMEELLQSKLDLSKTLLKQGLYSEGKELIQETLSYMNSIEDNYAGNKALALVLMGEALRLEGLYDQSMTFLEQGYDLFQQIKGSDHEHTIHARYQIGTVLFHMGKLEESESIFRQTLMKNKAVLGDTHPTTLENMGNLGNALFRQKRFEESETYHRYVYEARLELLGPEHHATLFTLNNLGSVLYKQKKYKEAESFCILAVDGFKGVLGAEHPDTLMAMNNLANVYRKQKRYQIARQLYQKTLAGQVKALGQEHRETNRTRFNLIRVLIRLEAYDEALPYCDQSISAMPDEPTCYYMKSEVLLKKEDYTNAISVLNQLLRFDKSNLDVRMNLLQSYLHVHAVEEAKKHFLIMYEELKDSDQLEEVLLSPLSDLSKQNDDCRDLLKQMKTGMR